MVSFKKYIAEAKSKEELEKYEKNYENIFGKKDSSKKDDATPEPKVSTEKKPNNETETPNQGEEISQKDIEQLTNSTNTERGIYGNSFNGNINFLFKNKNSSEAKRIKNFFSSGASFFEEDGSLVMISINQHNVISDGRENIIYTMDDAKIQEEKAQKFFETIGRSENLSRYIAYIYSILKNQAVLKEATIKILSWYLPKNILDPKNLDEIRKILFSESNGATFKRTVNNKNLDNKKYYESVKEKNSLLSYIVLHHLYNDVKSVKRSQYAEEIFRIPYSDYSASSKTSFPDIKIRRKADEEIEPKDEVNEPAEDKTTIEKEKNKLPPDSEEPKENLKPNIKSLKDKDIKSDIFSRKSYYEATQEEVEEEFAKLRNYINQEKILNEFKGNTKSEIFSYSMKDVDTVVKDLMSSFTKEDWKKKKKYIKNVKLYGGKITGPIASKLTKDENILKKIDEDVNYNKIDKKAHKGIMTPEMTSRIGVKNVFEYFDNYTKGIKNDAEKRARYIINKFLKEASSRISKAEKKLNILKDTRKTIKNYNEADYLNDIGYNLNSAKSYFSEMAESLNNLLKNYKESVLALVGTTTLEKQRIDKIMSNKKEFKVLENRAKENPAKNMARKKETEELVKELKDIEGKIQLAKIDNKLTEKEKKQILKKAEEEKAKKKFELERIKKENEEEFKKQEEKPSKEQERNKAIDSYLSRDSKSGEGKAPGIIDKIKTFSSETKEAAKGVIDRAQLKKKFDEVKKEFSQKKTISASIKDRMINFLKKLAEKPSTVETAKIMLDRNKPKTQEPTQQVKKPVDKAVNESVSYLTEDELSSNIASKTAELFKPHKLANDKIFINLRKAVNAGDKDAFVKPLVEIKNTLLSGNAPTITILTYADNMINLMNTIITKIDDLDDKMTDEEYKDSISAVNALNNFIETGLTNLQNQLEKAFSAQPQQETQPQAESVPTGAKPALTTKAEKEDKEVEKDLEKKDETEEETEDEPKNLLALAKQKLKSGK